MHPDNEDDVDHAGVGEPNPDFVDSKEVLNGGRDSSCDEFSSSDEEEEEHDDVDLSLEAILWPPELLHGPNKLKKKRGRQSSACEDFSTTARTTREEGLRRQYLGEWSGTRIEGGAAERTDAEGGDVGGANGVTARDKREEGEEGGLGDGFSALDQEPEAGTAEGAVGADSAAVVGLQGLLRRGPSLA